MSCKPPSRSRSALAPTEKTFSGLPAKRIPPPPSRSNIAARSCNPANDITGRSVSGIIKAASLPGANAPGGKWGFFSRKTGKPRWIQPGGAGRDAGNIARDAGNPLLRTRFTISRAIASATVYITAHGLYEARLNGRRIGDAYLTPGWTSYNKRLQYQAYDVTGLLHKGVNAIGALLGNGWYRGTIGFDTQHNVYGKDNSLLLQLIIRYKDGSSDTVATGPGWRSSTGDVRSSEIYNGERIDHRFAKTGWSLPDYDDSTMDTCADPKTSR